MIHLTTGKPGEGMTYTSCTSPTRKNEAARSLAAPVASELGACISSTPIKRAMRGFLRGAVGDWCAVCSGAVVYPLPVSPGFFDRARERAL